MLPLQILVIIAGVYLIALSFLVSAKDMILILLYKVVPFLLGMGCVFAGVVWMGIIQITLKGV